MGKIYLAILVLYSFFVAIGFLWLRTVKKRRKDIVGKSSPISEIRELKADIVGKSKFDLLPAVSGTLPKEERKPSAEIPPEELDEVFSDTSSGKDDDEILMDIDYPLEFEEEIREESEEEPEEEESEEVAGAAQAAIASGVRFEELGNMVRTVNNPENATTEQREQAGDTLLEMRKTDMFECLVSSEGKVQLALQLMDERLTAYHKELDSKAGSTGKKRKALPADFNIKDFFY